MEKTFKFTMTEAEADLVVKFLSEGPYKLTARLIASLQMQYQGQQDSETRAVESEQITNGSLEKKGEIA